MVEDVSVNGLSAPTQVFELPVSMSRVSMKLKMNTGIAIEDIKILTVCGRGTDTDVCRTTLACPTARAANRLAATAD